MPATASAKYAVVPAVEDDGHGPLFEIVDGERVEKVMSSLSQGTGFEIAFWLRLYLHEEQLDGFVSTEMFIACFEWMPNTKRRPDVAYWHAHQLPDGIPAVGDIAVAPALCVEVTSPNDVISDLDVKIGEYFRAGVDLVWIVNPQTRTVRTEQPDGTAHVYRDDDTLTGGPVLPKLSLPLAKLFPKVQR